SEHAGDAPDPVEGFLHRPEAPAGERGDALGRSRMDPGGRLAGRPNGASGLPGAEEEESERRDGTGSGETKGRAKHAGTPVREHPPNASERETDPSPCGPALDAALDAEPSRLHLCRHPEAKCSPRKMIAPPMAPEGAR